MLRYNEFMTHTQQITLLLITFCWGIFLIFWLISAAFAKHTVWRQSIGERSKHLVLMALGAILIIDSRNFNLPDLTLWPFTLTVGVISVILAVIGLIVLLWARINLGRNWSGRVVLKENHQLITTGLYSLVRHPIYSGFLLLGLATALNYGTLLPFVGVALLMIAISIRIRAEEALMTQQFPNEYPQYMKRTKRIIPWIW